MEYDLFKFQIWNLLESVEINILVEKVGIFHSSVFYAIFKINIIDNLQKN